MLKRILKHKLLLVLSIIAFLVVGAVLMYNFGWRLWGFSACVSPERYITYHYEIKDDSVEILFTKNDFHGIGHTLGYITEEKDGVLKIGIKYYIGLVPLLFGGGARTETIEIPFKTKPQKIILCGNDFEIDINDHVNEEFYQDYLDTIQQIEEQEQNRTSE